MNGRVALLASVLLAQGCIDWAGERRGYCEDGGPGCREDEYPDRTDGGDPDGGADAGEEPFVWDGGRVMRALSPRQASAVVNSAYDALEVELYEVDGGRPEGIEITFSVDAGTCDEWEGNCWCDEFGCFPSPARASFNPSIQLLTATDDTSSAGRAQSPQLHANTATGTFQVIATAEGFDPVMFLLTNTHGTPTQLQVVSPGSPPARPGEVYAQPLHVAVRDQWSNPVLDAQVRYMAQTADGLRFGAAEGPTEVITGMDASVGYSSSGPIYAHLPFGSQQVAVQLADGGLNQTVNLQVVTGPAYEVRLLSAGSMSAPLNGHFPAIEVEAKDDAGYPLLPDQNGWAYFNAPWDDMGSVATCRFYDPYMGYDQPSISLQPVEGIFRAECRARDELGTYPLQITFQNSTRQLSVTLTNTAPAETISVGSGNNQVLAPAGFSGADMVVLVKDAFSDPVPGARVTFMATNASGSSVRFSNQESSLTVFTDADGYAFSGSFQATAQTGPVSVTASLPDRAPTITAVTFNHTIQ